MNELRPLLRAGPQPQALHFSYEKAGLIVRDAAIPWNADAVLVEASLWMRPPARRKSDFSLRLRDGEPISAEFLRPDEGDRHRLFFRLPPPPSSTSAELCWRDHSLGQLTLPMLSSDEFVRGLRIDMPTFFARIGQQNVACQTFVASQCKGLQASAVLVSRTASLAPLAESGVRAIFRCERDGSAFEVRVPLTGAQLQARQALLTAAPRRLPRRMGVWTVTWQVGDTILATQRAKAISQKTFHKSLRISDTRFVVVDWKQVMSIRRQLPPLVEVNRVGPCFLVSSKEPGMAGLCTLQVHAQVPGGIQSPLLLEQEVLVTDGPTMFAPGTLDVGELGQTAAFELRQKLRILGLLALSPVPTASFTSEGGFRAPAGDFLWTSAADDELTERLNRLMNGK
jgi:hypothetical protein